MLKTEVFDVIAIFIGAILADFGRFWPILGLKSGFNFFGDFFWPKNDWSHALHSTWG
jgi:hypothetical protein